MVHRNTPVPVHTSTGKKRYALRYDTDNLDFNSRVTHLKPYVTYFNPRVIHLNSRVTHFNPRVTHLNTCITNFNSRVTHFNV